MALMTQMRRSMPLILWILVIAFVGTIIFSWGMGGFKERVKPGIVGIINGNEISREFYDRLVNQEIENKKQQTGMIPDPATERNIRNQTWDALIEETIVAGEIDKRGITVSDSEIVMMMLNNPFDYIVQSEYFQTDGRFDITKYHAFLQDPRSKEQVIYWEQSYRQNLSRQKFLNQIISTVEVTSYELMRRFEERNVMGKAKFLKFPVDSFEIDSASITEQMIEDYYFSNMDNYKEPAQRRIVYAQITNLPTDQDSMEIRTLGREIKERLDNQEDFGRLAILYSDHHTSADSGKLGWTPKLRLEESAEAAVWAIDVGEYTDAVEGRYGIQIYKVKDRKKIDGELQNDLSIIQLKFVPSSDTKDMIVNKMLNFAEDIVENDFLLTAQSYDLEVDSSGFFGWNPFIPGLGKMKSAVDFSFNNPVGSTSELYPLRNGWLVLKVIGAVAENYSPLEKVRDDIYEVLAKNKKLELATASCQSFLDALVDKSDWVKEAEEKGLEIFETENEFRLDDYIPDVGREPVFNSLLFRSKVGELNGPIVGKEACFAVELTEILPFDSTAFNAGLKDYMPSMLQGKQESVYKEWLESVKKKAKIEDFRYKYYRAL